MIREVIRYEISCKKSNTATKMLLNGLSEKAIGLRFAMTKTRHNKIPMTKTRHDSMRISDGVSVEIRNGQR